jgi:hypothetical protein
MGPSCLSFLCLLAFFSSVVVALKPPTQLYSNSVADKTLNTTNSVKQSAWTFPQYTDQVKGDWQWFPAQTWTSGFFPASLYLLNSRAKRCPKSYAAKYDWLELGRKWSEGLVQIETVNNVQHDVGFISFPFQQELLVYRHVNHTEMLHMSRSNPTNKTAITAINALAQRLVDRYSPRVGLTRSWDWSGDDYPVIMDNMMNLEVQSRFSNATKWPNADTSLPLQLLLKSAALTGNATLKTIATSHANKTILNHIRPDGAFHLGQLYRHLFSPLLSYRWFLSCREL